MYRFTPHTVSGISDPKCYMKEQSVQTTWVMSTWNHLYRKSWSGQARKTRKEAIVQERKENWCSRRKHYVNETNYNRHVSTNFNPNPMKNEGNGVLMESPKGVQKRGKFTHLK